MAETSDGGGTITGGRGRALEMMEKRVTPTLSLYLGYGAMAPLALAALAAWAFADPFAGMAARVAVFWGGALLLFLAGVRRGLSFRTPEGPRAPEIGAVFWLFGLALLALTLEDVMVSAALLLVGFGSLAVIDPLAAWRGEAPPFFARLRPVQMAIPAASFAGLLATQS